jgi:hypothetical protein
MGAILAAIPLLSQLLQLIPSPADRAKAVETLQQMELEIIKGQLQINEEEAKSESLFVSGWRPAVGWMGVFGLGFQVLAPVFGLPIANTEVLVALLTGLLGLGGARTVEKIKGVARK